MRRPLIFAGALGVVIVGATILAWVLTGSVVEDAGTPPPTLIVEESPVVPERIARITGAWNTDWGRRTIDLEDLIVGVPVNDPRDNIRPIDAPLFESIAAADTWLDEREVGAMVTLGGEARFYPLRIISRHEVVNDVFSGLPVVVTYCPLCNSAATFDRRIAGSAVRFGVSGLLHNSDLVMWDSMTESLWQQITGEAIVGDLAGTKLEILPTSLVRWTDFKAAQPGGAHYRGTQAQECATKPMRTPAMRSRHAPARSPVISTIVTPRSNGWWECESVTMPRRTRSRSS